MDFRFINMLKKIYEKVVTDLPFGKRISEGMLGVNNRTLYTDTLKELARVVRRRCVIQSQVNFEISLIFQNIRKLKKLKYISDIISLDSELYN